MAALETGAFEGDEGRRLFRDLMNRSWLEPAGRVEVIAEVVIDVGENKCHSKQ